MNITITRVEKGQDTLVDRAWSLKESIRRKQGILKQGKRFFENSYRRSTVYCLMHENKGVLGFASVDNDGYILFLAIEPEEQGNGFGSMLVEHISEEHSLLSCHVRTTNKSAINFYEELGFERFKTVHSYYGDGGSAYYMKKITR